MTDQHGVGPGQSQAGGPPGGHDPYPPTGAPYPPSSTKTSGMAITAFVLSVLFFIPLLPLVGAILGIVATVRISRRRHELGGMGLAVAAIPTGFVIFIFTIGIYAAIAIPAFIKYTRKAKTVEATEGLDRLKVGARAYFQSERYDEGGKLLASRFPPGHTDWVPKTPCCKGATRRCIPADSEWSVEPWRSLRFSMSEPHYFQWRYRSAGEGRQAHFIVEARADLDCDGKYSSYKLGGQVDEGTNVVTRGPIITAEIE